jgi:hypothetical protein
MFEKKPKSNEEIEAEWKRYIQIKKTIESVDQNEQI